MQDTGRPLLRNRSRQCEPMSRSKRQEFNEDEFFGFAKSYLSEAFPNPHRIDCPAESDLQRMAEHSVPERDNEISKHLTCCSPSFNRYMEILAGLKRGRAG
jgi:hypothetical protein